MGAMILNLLVAHFIGDFYLQNSCMCKDKVRNNWKGWGMILHTFLIGVLSWLCIMDCAAWWIILLLMASHFAIDSFKSYLQVRYCVIDSNGKDGDKARYDLNLFVIDQILHVGVIIGLVCLWFQIVGNTWRQFDWIIGMYQQHPLWMKTALAFVLVLKPANILVLLVLKACKVDVIEKDHGNFHSGALIGYIERGLVLLFVILSQYEAIGFLLTAKSILRFSQANSESEKSEYVLAGSLISLAIALLLGVFVAKF
jgi:uncharacterized membrane protein YidH (DUF202 family)